LTFARQIKAAPATVKIAGLKARQGQYIHIMLFSWGNFKARRRRSASAARLPPGRKLPLGQIAAGRSSS